MPSDVFHRYRCSECGQPRPVLCIRAGEEPSVIACNDHPGAEVISCSWRTQALLVLMHKGIHQEGKTLDDLRAEVAEGHADAAAVFALFERWGRLPERTTNTTGPATPAGLYG